MKVICLAIVFATVVSSCSDKKLEITSDYIINENWNKNNEQASANSITVEKMVVREDSTINPFSDLSQSELLDKLEEDSSFMHFANVKIAQGEAYKNKKIFFNRDNGFYWGSGSRHSSNDQSKTIGVLQPGCWYRFSDLGLLAHPYYVYIYIDSAKNAHRFEVNLSNY